MLQEHDRDIVSGQIFALDRSLSQLEAVESKLAGELSELRSKIEKVRKQRAALESRIAAVWSLPNEILSYIFELGAMGEDEDEEDEDEDEDEDENENEEDLFKERIEFRFLVSQVCRMFRQVAIRTPSLWTQIHISDLGPPRIDLVRTCVERSGSSGLDIFIDCDEPNLGKRTEPIQSLMDILAPQIPRFRRFTARLRTFHALHRIMQALDQPAPQLETLELSEIDYDKAFDESDPFDPTALREALTLFRGVVPKLERVSFDGVHVAWANCNFANLVEFHMGYHTRDVRPSYDEFKAIIDASPNLRCLDLRGSAPLLSDNVAESCLYVPFRMDHLEDLTISDIPSDYATTLIGLLHAANLKSLALRDLDTNDYSAFLGCIAGPPVLFPALAALKISTIESDDASFEGLLRAFANMTHLTLYFSRMPASWLNFLEPRGTDQTREVLCPKLECLRCVGLSTFDIKQVLEKRSEAGFPIAKLEIDHETEAWATKPCMEWIRENTTVEIIEPSDIESDDDEEMHGDTGSEWTDDDLGGFPYFSMEGFSDEDGEDDDDDDEDEEEEEDSGNDDDNEMDVEEDPAAEE